MNCLQITTFQIHVLQKKRKNVAIKLKLKRINQTDLFHYTTCLIAKQTGGIIHQVGKIIVEKSSIRRKRGNLNNSLPHKIAKKIQIGPNQPQLIANNHFSS